MGGGSRKVHKASRNGVEDESLIGPAGKLELGEKIENLMTHVPVEIKTQKNKIK